MQQQKSVTLPYLQRNAGMVLLKILQADLKMQLTSTSDDMLTRLLDDALHHGVRLGQAFQTLHQFGQVSRVLGLNSDSHHRADTKLHHTHVMGLLEGGDCSGLHQKLVHTNQTDDVTTRYILDGLDVTTHHQNGPAGNKRHVNAILFFLSV